MCVHLDLKRSWGLLVSTSFICFPAQLVPLHKTRIQCHMFVSQVLLKSDATSASGSSQPYRGDDRDAIAKCESGFGTTLRGAVWGAEWMAYGAKYALVQSFGLLDKTVATGGCRRGVSPGELYDQADTFSYTPVWTDSQQTACVAATAIHLTVALMAYNHTKQPTEENVVVSITQ